MENGSFIQMLFLRIRLIKEKVLAIFNDHEKFIFNSSFVFLFVICSFYIFMTASSLVPYELGEGEDATFYLTVAEMWLKGQISIDVNYSFGLSLIEVPVILFGSIVTLDPIQSMVVFFLLVGCLNMCLLAVLSRTLTGNKWSYHLAFILVISDFRLVFISVRPLTDTVHATIILLMILIQIKLLDLLNGETRALNSLNKTPFLALALGVCSGILTTIRQTAFIFLLIVFFLWGVFLYGGRISRKEKATLLALIVIPAMIITFSYLFARSYILGDIRYLFYFGANSNIWVDSYAEQWYYVNNNLSNPTLSDYLQTHSMKSILQREVWGILYIFLHLFEHFSVFLIFLALGALILFRNNYRISLVLLAPVFYLVTIYGWFWIWLHNERFLLPIYYIFYLITIYGINHLFTKTTDKQTSLRSLGFYFVIAIFLVSAYLITLSYFRLKIYLSNYSFDFILTTSIIAFLVLFGFFTLIFYHKTTKELIIHKLRLLKRYL